MKKVIAQSQIINKCIAEMLGTLLLILFGVGCVAGLKLANVMLSQWEVSVIWGFGVALAIYLTASVSGAHLNPAVTIALCLFKKCECRIVLPYIFSQLLGAFIGAAIVYTLYHNLFIDIEQGLSIVRNSSAALPLAAVFSTYPHPSISLWQALMVEIVITAILMAVISALTDKKNSVSSTALVPLIIGILIAVIGSTFGPLTGFAMNPARDFGPKIFAYLAGWSDIVFTGGKEIPYFLIPIVGPIIGAILGAALYHTLISPNIVTTAEKK